MTVLACAGHWYLSLLYVAPVAAIAAVIKVSTVREARRERGASPQPATSSKPSGDRSRRRWAGARSA